MSSSTSPLHVLQEEAKRTALTLDKTKIKFGVAMDDKFLIVEMDRALILKSSHEALAAMIVRETRGEKTQ